MDLVQAASVSIHGQHGQYIENIHLETYDSDEEFWGALYCGAYSRLLKKAQHFLESTDTGADDAMVFISCGFVVFCRTRYRRRCGDRLSA